MIYIGFRSRRGLIKNIILFDWIRDSVINSDSNCLDNNLGAEYEEVEEVVDSVADR